MSEQNDRRGRFDRAGACHVINVREWDAPHVRVSWYEGWGLWTQGVTAVREGETPDQAADRAFPSSALAKAPRCVGAVEWQPT